MIVTDSGQFQITFANGYKVSLGNANHHYHSERDLNVMSLPSGRIETSDAEIALIDTKTGDFVICPNFENAFQNDDVTGWKDSEWIGRFMTKVQALKYGEAKPRVKI